MMLSAKAGNPSVHRFKQPQKPEVRFGGKESLTSGFSQRYQVGDEVVIHRLAKENDYQDEYVRQRVEAIEPHHGEVDSFGSGVPDGVTEANDHADMVTFLDKEGKRTRVLVGEYMLASEKPLEENIYTFEFRHEDGKAFSVHEEGKAFSMQGDIEPKLVQQYIPIGAAALVADEEAPAHPNEMSPLLKALTGMD